MTRLFNDPAYFADDMLAGFIDANSRYVVGVPGGVVRADATPEAKVAVVVGGGSGHYPAFCGVVGSGFADGAVVGNVFTSPSADDAYSVGRNASGGAGVLFITGNYAGDVMNFTQGRSRLERDGIVARTVFVTDDVASAPAHEATARRGIAGDFVVFKIAGAAAEEGLGIDDVERVATRANANTRTLGVAFAGCTMPGAREPLFTVAPGKMGVGLGIHGEPGISEDDLPSAADLARLLVDQVTAELPVVSGARVGAILNGLGGTKYEELFVLWRSVSQELASRGYTVVDPEVGELVTSLDMAGCSLTLVALDDELERLWCAPADSPAYRKGVIEPARSVPRRLRVAPASAPEGEFPSASTEARRCAATAFAVLQSMSEAIAAHEEELARLDAVAGDGDHGRGMVRGITAAVDAARDANSRGAGVGSLLISAGHEWAARAGGTSGVLWGAALAAAGGRLGDDSQRILPHDVVAAVREGLAAIYRLGNASRGDKTMIDAFEPFVDRLDAAVARGDSLARAWGQAATVATAAAQATADLVPRVGRARPLGERSVGTPDPGATSFALAADAAARVLADSDGVLS